MNGVVPQPLSCPLVVPPTLKDALASELQKLKMELHSQQLKEPAASFPVQIHYCGPRYLARGVLPGSVSMLSYQVVMQGSNDTNDYSINCGTSLKRLHDTLIKRGIMSLLNGPKDVRIGNYPKSVSLSKTSISNMSVSMDVCLGLGQLLTTFLLENRGSSTLTPKKF